MSNQYSSHGTANHHDEEAFVVVKLNARLNPVERGRFFEMKLGQILEQADLGVVTGGASDHAVEVGTTACELHVQLANDSPETLARLIDELEQLGAPVGSKVMWQGNQEIEFGCAEGLALWLRSADFKNCSNASEAVENIVHACNQSLAERGKFRGFWRDREGAALYFYGASFEAMKRAIEVELGKNQFLKNAAIEQIA